MSRLALIAALAALASCAGRTEDTAEPERVRGRATVGGQVVSTVDGHAITLADVQHAVASTGVEPRVALRRLQDELILARAARRAGFAEDPAVRRAARQARVQALLAREVEARHRPEDVDEATLAQRFEENLAAFEGPERRGSVHVLARVPEGAPADVEDAARTWIDGVRRELAAAEDPVLAAFELQRRIGGERPFEVTVEELDPVSRRAAIHEAYLDALFALPAPGVAPEPVRTPYGWHAIVLTRIEPAWEASREEALEQLRQSQVTQDRAAATNALLEEIVRETDVHLSQPVVGAYLGRPDLLEGDG